MNLSNHTDKPTIIWNDIQAEIAHAKSYVEKSRKKTILE